MYNIILNFQLCVSDSFNGIAYSHRLIKQILFKFVLSAVCIILKQFLCFNLEKVNFIVIYAIKYLNDNHSGDVEEKSLSVT